MEREVIAQIFGIFGMMMNILSFQRKEQKQIIFMQLVGSMFFAVNYLLIGAFVGALLNVSGIFRATVYYKREFFRADKIYWVFCFSAVYVLMYILSFTVFGTEVDLKNFAVELLPVVGMIITTISFYLGSAKKVRKIGIVNAPLWLTYNVINFTIGGIITESVSLISIIIGMIRYDIPEKEKDNEKAES
jgi:hypothetical protein